MSRYLYLLTILTHPYPVIEKKTIFTQVDDMNERIISAVTLGKPFVEITFLRRKTLIIKIQLNNYSMRFEND